MTKTATKPAIEEMVVALLTQEGKTLAVAESCTGGRVGAKITSVPGSSLVFLGGILAYKDAVKEKLLGVPPYVIRHAGAVSQDCALAMAVGLARTMEADYNLAVTGIAGPSGGSREKPVGTVHFALATPEKVLHHAYCFMDATRLEVQDRAAQAALWLLYCALSGLDPDREAGGRGWA